MYLPNLLLWLLAGLFALPVYAQKTKTAEVRTFDGTPALWVDGQQELPFFYALTHVSGGRWSWEELPAHNLRHACSDGIRLFQVDLWLEDIWKAGEKRLDMDLARHQLRGVLDACPEAGIVVRLHVNAPMWWNFAHPDECVRYADGPVEEFPAGLPFNHEDSDVYRSRRASLASGLWRKDAGERVVEFCRRLQRTREGRAVIGLHLSCGVYGEWHPWGFLWNEPDVSPPMQQAFQRWLRTRYTSDQQLQTTWNNPSATLATATVPDTAARHCCGDGFFRDGQSEQRVIDFYKCQQEVIASDIEFFCRTVKETWRRPLITGVFYGYFHFSLCRQAMAGHLEIERLLKSPWIDYFAGPTSYYRMSRVAGGSGLERSIVQSILRHGKLWFDEVDNGYLQNKFERDFVRSQPLGDSSYLPLLQRSLWLPLVQGCGLWLYDFGPRRNTGWWDSELYRAEFRRTLDYFRRQPVHKPDSAATVLVVWDTESFYFVENITSKTCEQGLDEAAEDIQRCGVRTDHTFLFDLPGLNLESYRAILFMNAWKLSPEQRRYIRDSVATNKRTVIWNYLNGYSDGREQSESLLEATSGVFVERHALPDTVRWQLDSVQCTPVERVNPFFVASDTTVTALGYLAGSATPVLVRKQFPKHQSVYSAVPLHGSAVFRRLFREAGCAVLNERNDFTFDTGRLFLLHSDENGSRILNLASGKRIDLEIDAPQTLLLDSNGTVIFK